jgi:undecaprenyl diphosphate synthase
MEALPIRTSSLSQPPVHVAIIMDGNGRWALSRGLPRAAGHKRGAEAVKTAVESAGKMGVRYLTLFGFSSENWKRPKSEVSDLMGLLRYYLQHEVVYLQRNGVRLRVIGDRSQLAPDIVGMIDRAERETRAKTDLDLIIALNYGGRAELASAARDLAQEVSCGLLDPAEIDEHMVAQRLYTNGIPDPDVLIRTSGEKRLSNFLLWQLAYAELIFLDTLWPDFSSNDFEQAVAEYHQRERRYGATTV